MCIDSLTYFKAQQPWKGLVHSLMRVSLSPLPARGREISETKIIPTYLSNVFPFICYNSSVLWLILILMLSWESQLLFNYLYLIAVLNTL